MRMAKTSIIQARVEPELKEEGEAVLKQIGLSTSELLTMTFRQLVMRQGLPFDARIPNEETIAALNEPREKMKSFGSTGELFADLEKQANED